MLILIILIVFTFFHGFNSLVSFSSKPLRSLGIDFGTSGVRCIGICENSIIGHEDAIKWSESYFDGLNLAEMWIIGLHKLLDGIPETKRQSIDRICLSGTSASCLIYDTETKKVSRLPKMYNYNVYSNCPDNMVKDKVKTILKEYCPPSSPANSPTSTLPKLLEWHFESSLKASERLCHQVCFI